MKPINWEDLYVGHFSLDTKLLDPVLDEIGQAESRVGLGERSVILGVPGPMDQSRDETYHTPYEWAVTSYDREYVRSQLGNVPQFRCFVLRGGGGSLGGFWDEREWERLDARLLANREAPYRGFADVGRSLIGLPTYVSRGSRFEFSILAPLYAKFDPELTLRGSVLKFRISTSATAKVDRDFQVAAILRRGDESRRGTYPIAGPGEKVGDVVRLSGTVDVGDSQIAELNLLFRDEPIDRLEAILPAPGVENPRIAAYYQFDASLDKLNRYLYPRQDDLASADSFDSGVSWVLNFCGLLTANYGRKGAALGNEIDLLAFVPYSRVVLAVEVTWRHVLNKDKLIKLRTRADALSESLPEHDVVPVLVTALEKAYTETSEAAELKIAILRPEHLRALFEMARANRPPQDVIDYVKGLVGRGGSLKF